VLPSTIATTDYHTGGEPFRIVSDPPVPIPGETVAERRARVIEDAEVQGMRAVLCSEPRGHADMYGGFVVPPDDAGGDLGVLFWHKDGFSTACGHGPIALGVWAVETGRVTAPATGSVDVVIDVPGRLRQRNVTVFADGEVDRSPCGSGTCARLAVLAAEGRLPAGAVLRHDSIVGSTFTGTVLDTVEVDGRAAVIPQVTGMAYRTGEHVFSIDPHDPLVPGFVLR
jgi:proline racemase